MSKHPLKPGEKILLAIFGVFFVVAVIAYAVLETVRLNSDEPMFVQRTHFDLSEQGHQGSALYRFARCNSCHRAMRTGTSMGLSLDGLGSKRTVEWIEDFLHNPEEMYRGKTLDHGSRPKEAAYVASMPAEDLHLIAVFLSELKADRGSSVARLPPTGRSEFIDKMVGAWAPDSWKEKYQDVRDSIPQGQEAGAE